MTMPITKYNFIVKDISKLAQTLRRAFTIAKSGRPGPVLVHITKDVTANTFEYEYQEPQEIERQTDTITEEDMEQALHLIRNHKNHLFLLEEVQSLLTQPTNCTPLPTRSRLR